MPHTLNAELQAKLDELANLVDNGLSQSFIRAFVPHDIAQDENELQEVIRELSQDTERLKAFKAEVKALSDGSSVRRITGDQQTEATFVFTMPQQSTPIERVRCVTIASAQKTFSSILAATSS